MTRNRTHSGENGTEKEFDDDKKGPYLTEMLNTVMLLEMHGRPQNRLRIPKHSARSRVSGLSNHPFHREKTYDYLMQKITKKNQLA